MVYTLYHPFMVKLGMVRMVLLYQHRCTFLAPNFTGPMAKEIIDGQLVFHNAPSVEAALRGRLLILEGLQKAERNVLPLLNNLLENREMSLEDGGSDAFGIT